MNLFEHPFNYDLGSLDSTPVERSTFLEENEYENDIYQFDLSQTSDLNISLNNLSTGDDADLYLYQDSNGNGVLDSHDTLLDSSRNGGDSEDSINYEANAGTYFTRVEFYNGGDDGRINYDLDLSA
ncbi:MAG: PPC domain-containing protein, partial [Xenococcaceae cyanobacterium]